VTTRLAKQAMSGSWVTSTTVMPNRSLSSEKEPHDLPAAPAVQVPRGLVRQHQGGLPHDAPGDGHPLLLSPGELVGHVALPPLQSHPVQGLPGPFGPDPVGHPPVEEGQLHVRQGGGAGKQVEPLEDEADAPVAHLGQFVPLQGPHLPTRQAVPPLRGGVQAAQDVHEGGLCRSPRPP
jgi:hypothetical protein